MDKEILVMTVIKNGNEIDVSTKLNGITNIQAVGYLEQAKLTLLMDLGGKTEKITEEINDGK